MIKLINESEFELNKPGADFSDKVNPDLIRDNDFSNPLTNYLLLTYYAEKFNNRSDIEIYYNRYYWFLTFMNIYISKTGTDNLNLRQQEFKILEEGESYDEIDWQVVEAISKEVNS